MIEKRIEVEIHPKVWGEEHWMEFSTTHVEADSYRDEPSGRVPDSEFVELLRRYGHERHL